jgi:hypothetical protein
MQTKKIAYGALVALLLITGCGSNSSSSSESVDSGELQNSSDSRYIYKVINNRGEAVTSEVGAYEIALYSDTKEKANDKSPHKGVVVKLNSNDSALMPIQETYMHKDIVAKIYEEGSLIGETEAVEVTDNKPVIMIDVAI